MGGPYHQPPLLSPTLKTHVLIHSIFASLSRLIWKEFSNIILYQQRMPNLTQLASQKWYFSTCKKDTATSFNGEKKKKVDTWYGIFPMILYQFMPHMLPQNAAERTKKSTTPHTYICATSHYLLHSRVFTNAFPKQIRKISCMVSNLKKHKNSGTQAFLLAWFKYWSAFGQYQTAFS